LFGAALRRQQAESKKRNGCEANEWAGHGLESSLMMGWQLWRYGLN
jgi:hypothetical protein